MESERLCFGCVTNLQIARWSNEWTTRSSGELLSDAVSWGPLVLVKRWSYFAPTPAPRRHDRLRAGMVPDGQL